MIPAPASDIRKKRTFGHSSYPFDSPYYGKIIEYKEGLCPVAEKELSRVGTLELNENWTAADAEDTSATIRKVAENLK